MRAIFLCVTLLLIGLVSKAQTNIASLNITLTDVQSVTFSSAALIDVTPDTKEISQNGALKVLSNSTSQIKQISSKTSEYEKLYKEFFIGKPINSPASSSTNSYSLAVNNTSAAKVPKSKNINNLVIFQVDPR